MSFFGGLFNDIQNAISNAVNTVTNDVKNTVVHPIETGSGQLFNDIQNALKNVTKEATNVVNNVGHLGKVVHNDLAQAQNLVKHILLPPVHIPPFPINLPSIHQLEAGIGHIEGETLSDVQHALAQAYHLTREGLTDLFTGAAATGREVDGEWWYVDGW